ncbi:MAG: hypothetical protein E7166_00850 [Firmicutes bacterium]|nr:hypothetical protein [Bacillota bacterium]
MKEYFVHHEDLEITIKYDDDNDLIKKLDNIICDLISYGYGSYDIGTDGMLEAIRNDDIYDEDFIVKNSTYKDIDI